MIHFGKEQIQKEQEKMVLFVPFFPRKVRILVRVTFGPKKLKFCVRSLLVEYYHEF
jgi:hypothetical protein